MLNDEDVTFEMAKEGRAYDLDPKHPRMKMTMHKPTESEVKAVAEEIQQQLDGPLFADLVTIQRDYLRAWVAELTEKSGKGACQHSCNWGHKALPDPPEKLRLWVPPDPKRRGQVWAPVKPEDGYAEYAPIEKARKYIKITLSMMPGPVYGPEHKTASAWLWDALKEIE